MPIENDQIKTRLLLIGYQRMTITKPQLLRPLMQNSASQYCRLSPKLPQTSQKSVAVNRVKRHDVIDLDV